jgi:drug/metabolite transporter (DMT)-like permease
MEREYWLVAIAAILYGTITVGAQFFVNLGLSLYEISVYPLLFISLVLLPFLLFKRQYMITKEMIIFFLIYGLIGALLTITQAGGIVVGVPVAVVALLLYTQPIWTTILGRFMINEQITPRKIIAVFFALAGVILLLKPWDVELVGAPIGIISALLGGVFLSLWIIWGRKSNINKQHPITAIAGWMGFAVIWLLLLWPVVSLIIPETDITRLSVNFPLEYWIYLAIYGLLARLIPFTLFYRGVQRIQASIAGVIMLLEPVGATIMAAILFIQPIEFNILSGGVLILFSNYIIQKEIDSDVTRIKSI